MTDDEQCAEPFCYADGDEVPPGEKQHLQHSIGETYLGNPIEFPITIINGSHPGPRIFLSAAVHGDELNGVKVLQEVAAEYDPTEIHGTIVCLHVLNVPGFVAQQRYIPVYDQDLNRAFPGRRQGTTASRMADEIYRQFVSQCDVGIDFHTSTRHRTTLFHVRGAMNNQEIERLAFAFGTNVIISSTGSDGMLRTVATNDGIPTITVELGKAHRFQPLLIAKALNGVESVLAEYGLLPHTPVDWPGWYRVIDAKDEKRWIRADVGGLVDMEWGPFPFVYEGDPICTISDHFKRETRTVTSPVTGLIVGFLENPIAFPGHPLCHIVQTDRSTRREIEAEIRRGEFDGYGTAHSLE